MKLKNFKLSQREEPNQNERSYYGCPQINFLKPAALHHADTPKSPDH